MEMELLGVASTVLTTKPFVSQARAMARLRGDADYGLAIIDHPIVTLNHEELVERAASRRAAGDAASGGQVDRRRGIGLPAFSLGRPGPLRR